MTPGRQPASGASTDRFLYTRSASSALSAGTATAGPFPLGADANEVDLLDAGGVAFVDIEIDADPVAFRAA